MTLIKSISGIRGTIGGAQGENLTPIDAVMYGAAYGTWVKKQHDKDSYKVVVGRDARISGNMIQELVMNTLVGLGINVINLDLSTTPTVEMAVMMEHADGGIILTASHNPKQWNALKLLNNKGEFLDASKNSPLLLSNFKAFHCFGLWLAVSMMPPSACSIITAISTVGVVDKSRLITFIPKPTSVFITNS